MKVKSRAAILLEKFCEQDDFDSVTSPETDGAVGDIAGDTSAADDQPHDENPDSPSLQDLGEPEKMAEVLDVVADQCDQYMDEEDDSCFTPQTDDEKNAIVEARGLARRAGQIVRGLKR